MALEVEDGTGKANAESYISVADADTRRSNLGGDAGWTAASTAEKEAALRKSTEYMLQAYRDRWQGYRQVTEQALDWPRNSVVVDEFVVVDSDVVPAEVKNACADLALKAISESLAPDLERAVVRERVGPIETEYDRASPQSKRFRAIDMMLAPYLTGGGANMRLVRA